MATATTVTATTFAVFMVVTMIVAVAVAAAATVMTVVMIVIVAMSAVYVTVLQLFCSGFAQGDNFYVELQILASQHVVAVNHHEIVADFGDFYRYRTPVGFSRGSACQPAVRQRP